jgi:phage N-6-adenine-methyltransferase
MTPMKHPSSSPSDEFYTPQHLWQPALDMWNREKFTLDPAGHPDSIIPAHYTFSKEDDGLSRPWAGHIWLNPPFSKVLPFIEQAVRFYDKDQIQAVILVKADTRTKWSKLLHSRASATCRVMGNTKFINGTHSAPFPIEICYLGHNPDLFAQHYHPVGKIYLPWSA